MAVLAGLSAGGSGAAPHGRPVARTLVTTHARITQFARDGHWLAWTTVRNGYERRLHLLSLRTHRDERVGHVDVDSADGTLALAGSRAAWANVNGQGNTETDIEIDTAGADNLTPRTVREMVTSRDDYDPEPLPPLAGRASVLVYFRHDQSPVSGRVVTAVERIVDGRPKRVFRTPYVSYLRIGEIRSGKVRILAFSRGPVVGVAINGRSVTWAENTGKSSGRIRTITLPR